MKPIPHVIDGPAGVPENRENVATACVICSHNCGLRVDVQDNAVVGIRGDASHPSSLGYTCNKGYAIPQYIRHALRVQQPLKRQPDGSFSPISWDQAIREIADRLNAIRRRHSPRAIGLAGIGGQGNHSNGFGGIPFMYSLGSPMFFNALGQEKIQHALVDRRLFRATHDLYMPGDEHNADYVIIIGSNPMISNRGINATDTIKAVAGDASRRMVVIDPRVTETSRRANRHLRVKPGADVFLLLALAGIIVQEGLVNQSWLQHNVRDGDRMLRLLQWIDVMAIARRSGVALEDIEATACEFAAAKNACISYDLGIEQIPHSTLVSYLIRVVLLLTGRVGQRGGNPFVQLFGPKLPYLPFMPRARVSGLRAVPMFVPLGQFSPNLIPEEIQSSHRDHLRALIVDGANPLCSYADTQRFREALAELELLVVIEPAMTETARMAHYVLPTPTGYEKWEMSLFPKDIIVPQVRPPVVNGPAEALPEVEIYYRLARAMELVPPAPRALHLLAARARTALGAPAYLGALTALAGARLGRPQAVFGRTAFWLYETLGPRLPNPMLSLAWLTTQGYALTRRAQIERALPAAKAIRNPFALAELIFQKLLDHPEGVVVGQLDGERNFEEFCGYRDKKARIWQNDFIADIQRLLRSKPAPDKEFPFVLNGGLRTGWSANTIIRDPSWRKGKGPHAALHISTQDAERLGYSNGTRVRLTSRRASVIVPVKIDAGTLPGHLHLPNIFDLHYPDPVTGELKATGISINSLVDVRDRDPYTAIPHTKYIRCRVEAVDEELSGKGAAAT